MAKKEYLYEVQVSRGWGGVEEVRIAAGTNNKNELKEMVNTIAESMQDRADAHTKALREVEEAARKNIERADAERKAEEAAASTEQQTTET